MNALEQPSTRLRKRIGPVLKCFRGRVPAILLRAVWVGTLPRRQGRYRTRQHVIRSNFSRRQARNGDCPASRRRLGETAARLVLLSNLPVAFMHSGDAPPESLSLAPEVKEGSSRASKRTVPKKDGLRETKSEELREGNQESVDQSLVKFVRTRKPSDAKSAREESAELQLATLPPARIDVRPSRLKVVEGSGGSEGDSRSAESDTSKFEMSSAWTNDVSVVTLPGTKHELNMAKNQDTGYVWEFNLKPKVKNAPLSYHCKLAWIFDGHGDIQGVTNAGKKFSEAAALYHKETLRKQFEDLVAAPVLSKKDIKYKTSSRQSLFSRIMNETRNRLHTDYPVLCNLVGTTATSIFAAEIVDRSTKKKKTHILCTNLGDSRALAMTFRKSRVLPTHVRPGVPNYTFKLKEIRVLTQEENIKNRQQRAAVFARALMGQGAWKFVLGAHPDATSRGSGGKRRRRGSRSSREDRANRDLVFAAILPPYERRAITQNIVRHAQLKDLVQTGARLYGKYTAFGVQENYLVRLDAKVDEFPIRVVTKGLQMTGSLGDRPFEPFKTSARSAKDVSTLSLDEAADETTFVLAASDGLWNYVDAINKEDPQAFPYLLEKTLNSCSSECRSSEFATKLARWAGDGEPRDDVTVAVLEFPHSRMVGEDASSSIG